jgi:hypothetical protein
MATYDRRDSFYVELENSELMSSGKTHDYGFTDFVTKGIPLTLASVVNSFVNTPAAIGRMFGADTKDWVEMADYGFSQNTLQYYEDNQAAIDTAALIGGSFIPGLASVKALKLAQAGTFGAGTAKFAGFFNAGQKAAVASAQAEIAKGALSMTGALNAAKYRAVAYGFGEQALQAATWELATIATMQGNSAIESQDWKQLAENVAWGAVAGGIIGGSLDSISVLSGIKKEALKAEFGEKIFEISKRAGIGDYAQGDYVQTMLDSVFTKPVPGADTSAARKLKDTFTGAMQTAKQRLGLATPSGDDTILSSAFVDSLNNLRSEALKAGYADSAVRDEFNKQLRGLVSIRRINAEDFVRPPTAAISATKKGEVLSFANPQEAMAKARSSKDSDFLWFSAKRNAGNPFRVAYESDGIAFKQARADGADVFVSKTGKIRTIAPDVEQIPYPGQNRALTFEEAMARNAQVPEGQLNILPKYAKSQGTRGRLTSSLYTDLRTGEVFDEPFKHWSLADEAQSIELTADKSGIIINRNQIVKQDATKIVDYAKETVKDVTSRWAWVAAQIGKEGQESFASVVNKGAAVDVTDLPRLEGIRQYLVTNKIESLEEATNKLPLIQRRDMYGEEEMLAIGDLGEPLYESAVTVLDRVIEQSRKDIITDMLKAGADLDEVALKTGSSRKFIERLVGNDPAAKGVPIEKVDIKSYLAPTRAKLEYDVSAFTNDVDGNRIFGELDQAYRMSVAKDRLDTVSAAFFGTEFDKLKIGAKADEASTQGARPGALTATNEDAETLGGKVQFAGAQLTRIIQETTRKVSDEISSYMTAVVSKPAAGAEYAALRAVMSRTGEKFRILAKDSQILQDILENPSSFIPPELRKSIQEGGGMLAWAKAIKQDENGKYFFDVRDLPVGESGYVVAHGATAQVAAGANQAVKMTAYAVNEAETAQLLAQEARLNSRRLTQQNSLRAAQGRSQLEVFEDGVYFPPVNTKRYPHFAFVRKESMTVLDEKEEISFLVARSADELKTKMATLPSDYRAITKDQVSEYKKLMQDFDYDLVVNSATVDSDLKKRGLLSEFYPRANYQELLQDSLDHHLRMEAKLIRDHMEAVNAELFATLRGMSDSYKTVAKSHMGIADEAIKDPYQSYINTAMAIPERAGPFVSMWFDAQRRISEKASAVFNSIQETLGRPGAKPTDEDYTRMTEALARVGYGNPYKLAITGSAQQAFENASRLPPQQYLERWSSKLQAAVATMGIRLDLMQSFINAVSTPVMLTMQAEASRLQALKQSLAVAVPGDPSGTKLPGTMALMFRAVKDMSGAEGRKLTEYYSSFGAVRNRTADFAVHDLYDAIRIVPGDSTAATIQRMEGQISKFVEAAQKVTLSDKSEIFARSWAARTGHIIYEAAGYKGKELEAAILTFVNRVHGNHLTSQRPLLFQGWMGQAVGLYQTYQLNLIQQMVRELAQGRNRSVVMAMGAQGTLFGMQGLPGFHVINDQLIGNAEGNTAHHDMYSLVPSYLGQGVGRFAIYGGVSNLLGEFGGGIYSRGDISPRQITVIPVLPQDWPAVAVSARAISNIANTLKQVANGGDLWETFTRGIEHNAMNRPVAGWAQILQGYSTTSKGSLISSNRPMDGNLLDMFTFANAGRMLGARPLDEAIALDDKFRLNLYRAADKERLTSLGAAVKSKLVGGGQLDDEELEEFALKYAAQGGRAENFGRTMIRWTRDANASVVNEVYGKMQTPVVQRAITVMGGEKLPDYLSEEAEGEPRM